MLKKVNWNPDDTSILLRSTAACDVIEAHHYVIAPPVAACVCHLCLIMVSQSCLRSSQNIFGQLAEVVKKQQHSELTKR